MTQVSTFPSEFNRKLFSPSDKNFALIWLATAIIVYGFFIYMQTFPPKELTDAQLTRFTETIYRVKPEVRAPVAAPTASSEVAEVTEEVVEEEPVVEEKAPEAPKPVTQDDRRQAREAAQQKRQAEMAAQADRAQKIAQQMAIVGGPTARRSGASGGASAIGITTGGSGDVDFKQMAGLVGDAGDADKVKKARGGAAVGGGLGDIDVSELRTISADDLNLMLSEASLDISQEDISVRGRGASAKGRDQSAISTHVMQNKNQVQYCYWVAKRRDSSLKGRVVARLTIEPSGEVSRVQFSTSEWGGNPIGKEVEKCIENVIRTWRFDPVDGSAGSVTAQASYTFE